MTGSLQVKNGKYYAVLNFKDENGKRKTKWVSTGLLQKGNEKRAKQILKNLLSEYDVKKVIPYEDVQFADYIKTWLEQARMRVDVITHQGYETTTKSHVLSYFEPLKLTLNEVTPQILQQYVNEKHKNGRIDGKGGLSAASIKLHMVVIQQTLKDALRKNLIPYNPADRVTLPKAEKFESGYYTAEQVHIMFEALKSEPLLPLIKVTVIYGLRRSELLGLKWENISFEAETVAIRHTVSKCTSTVAKDKTKNASSRRVYPMLPEIRAILLEAKERDSINKSLFGNEYAINDYVFKWDDGRPYDPDFISRKFRQLLQQYGLPRIRFHDLRHSCASMLYEMGYDLKDIMEWLGHSDIKMTGNLYAHFNMRQKQGIAESFEANFNSALEKALEKPSNQQMESRQITLL